MRIELSAKLMLSYSFIKIIFSFIFQNSASLTDSGISESGDNECEEALLSKLRSLAQDLQQQLTPKSNIIQEITQVRNFIQLFVKDENISHIYFMACSLDLSFELERTS